MLDLGGKSFRIRKIKQFRMFSVFLRGIVHTLQHITACSTSSFVERLAQHTKPVPITSFKFSWPFWPEVWSRWKEAFTDYVKLFPTVLVNKVSVLEAIKVKLLRLCLIELGQSTFNARRLDEASSMNETLNHLNRMRAQKTTSWQRITSSCVKQPKISYRSTPSST